MVRLDTGLKILQMLWYGIYEELQLSFFFDLALDPAMLNERTPSTQQ